MLTNEHHPTINRQQLYDMAVLGHNNLYKLVASWTGGTYEQVDTDYHINIGPKGQVYLTCKDLFEVKPHTRNANEGVIGIALDCGKDARFNGDLMDKGNFGEYPPTQEQLSSLGLVLAVLCKALDLPVKYGTVSTQWEVAVANGYGILSKDPHPRFDLIALPYFDRFKDCYSMFGCCYLRKLVKQEMKNLQFA